MGPPKKKNNGKEPKPKKPQAPGSPLRYAPAVAAACALAVAVGTVQWVDAGAAAACKAALADAERVYPNKTAMRHGWTAAAEAREAGCPWVTHLALGDLSCAREALAKAAFAQLTGTPLKRPTLRDVVQAAKAAEKAQTFGATDADLHKHSRDRLPGFAGPAYNKLRLWAEHRLNVTAGATRLPYCAHSDGEDLSAEACARLKRSPVLVRGAAADHPDSAWPRWGGEGPPAAAAAAAAFARMHGFARVADVLAGPSRAAVKAELKGLAGNEYYMNSENRKHVRVDPETAPAVRAAVGEMVRNARGLLESLVGSDADVVELAGFSTYSGAVGQMMHEDAHHMFAGIDAPIYTMFVALQDIAADMGPVEVWPDTHALRVDHEKNRERVRRGGGAAPFRGVVPAGTAVIIDGTVTHRGSEHLGGPQRDVLYITFVARPGMVPFGSTYAMLEHMIGRYTLSDVAEFH